MLFKENISWSFQESFDAPKYTLQEKGRNFEALGFDV
jgi:hypothetical protein